MLQVESEDMANESEVEWRDAIVEVLKQEPGLPLHYQRVTELIGERGIRSLTGFTPTQTVNRDLNSLSNPEHPAYNPNIQKVGTRTGRYVFVNPSDPIPEVDGAGADEEEGEETFETAQAVRVCAYGLHWEEERISWGKGEILGRQRGTSSRVNFAEQKGVYLLHQGDSAVYVGRASHGFLHARLNRHRRSSKALRWNNFSWFGFREVNDDGRLGDLSGALDSHQLIVILEAVLIEALNPPVNGQRGEGMGELYEQVTSPDIAAQQSREFLQRLSGG